MDSIPNQTDKSYTRGRQDVSWFNKETNQPSRDQDLKEEKTNSHSIVDNLTRLRDSLRDVEDSAPSPMNQSSWSHIHQPTNQYNTFGEVNEELSDDSYGDNGYTKSNGSLSLSKSVLMSEKLRNTDIEGINKEEIPSVNGRKSVDIGNDFIKTSNGDSVQVSSPHRSDESPDVREKSYDNNDDEISLFDLAK